MSNSVRPHRRQPTRLHRPWDSPGKNTGVGCHYLLQCMKVKSESEVTQSCPTLSDPMNCSLPGYLRPWDFPGKSSPGVGDGQGGLACCGSWGHKELDTTEWLNWTELVYKVSVCFVLFPGLVTGKKNIYQNSIVIYSSKMLRKERELKNLKKLAKYKVPFRD